MNRDQFSNFHLLPGANYIQEFNSMRNDVKEESTSSLTIESTNMKEGASQMSCTCHAKTIAPLDPQDLIDLLSSSFNLNNIDDDDSIVKLSRSSRRCPGRNSSIKSSPQKISINPERRDASTNEAQRGRRKKVSSARRMKSSSLSENKKTLESRRNFRPTRRKTCSPVPAEIIYSNKEAGGECLSRTEISLEGKVSRRNLSSLNSIRNNSKDKIRSKRSEKCTFLIPVLTDVQKGRANRYPRSIQNSRPKSPIRASLSNKEKSPSSRNIHLLHKSLNVSNAVVRRSSSTKNAKLFFDAALSNDATEKLNNKSGMIQDTPSAEDKVSATNRETSSTKSKIVRRSKIHSSSQQVQSNSRKDRVDFTKLRHRDLVSATNKEPSSTKNKFPRRTKSQSSSHVQSNSRKDVGKLWHGDLTRNSSSHMKKISKDETST